MVDQWLRDVCLIQIRKFNTKKWSRTLYQGILFTWGNVESQKLNGTRWETVLRLEMLLMYKVFFAFGFKRFPRD